MAVVYEWWLEERDEAGDVIQLHFWDNRQDAESQEPLSPRCQSTTIALTRSTFDNEGDLKDRQFAYLTDGNLPAKFDGGATVPRRYL